MLTLSRKTEEAILIGSDIRIVIKRIDGEIVKLGIEAPKNVPIYREEIFNRVSQQNQEALARAQGDATAGGELQLKFPPAAGA
ncbi:MAG: carbon storage regulator [Chthoniobacter sp.]|jgi:carbon storage regulator|nr:carbon storage regulator [Chthoniobacter sp.]